MGRLQLQSLLEELSEFPTERVYFQPPPNVTLQYPCIVYGRDNAHRASADNHGYRFVPRYQVTLIDRNPDSPVYEKLGRLPNINVQRNFTSGGLHHDVFELYFS